MGCPRRESSLLQVWNIWECLFPFSRKYKRVMVASWQSLCQSAMTTSPHGARTTKCCPTEWGNWFWSLSDLLDVRQPKLYLCVKIWPGQKMDLPNSIQIIFMPENLSLYSTCSLLAWCQSLSTNIGGTWISLDMCKGLGCLHQQVCQAQSRSLEELTKWLSARDVCGTSFQSHELWYVGQQSWRRTEVWNSLQMISDWQTFQGTPTSMKLWTHKNFIAYP